MNSGELCEAEQEAIRNLTSPRVTTLKGSEVHCPRNRLQFLLNGWAAYVPQAEADQWQIFGFVLPGDPIAVVHGHRRAYRVVALTPVETIDATELMQQPDLSPAPYPGIAAAVETVYAKTQDHFFDQIVRLGGRQAHEGLGHLLLELSGRLFEVGMVQGDRFRFPLAQIRFAESLGLSETHLVRTLRKLEADGLVQMSAGWISLPDRTRLAELVGYRHAIPGVRVTA